VLQQKQKLFARVINVFEVMLYLAGIASCLYSSGVITVKKVCRKKCHKNNSLSVIDLTLSLVRACSSDINLLCAVILIAYITLRSVKLLLLNT
jgi:hypothetical protein